MTKAKRHDGRRPNQLRPVTITPGFVGSADGSCLIETGGTRVICTASFSPGLPKWREGSGLGWLTAEYGMLPASTGRRKRRPTIKPDSRGVEIQRLIGRVVRNVVRFDRLGENTLHLDCDVLEADGGTRTASITGAYVAAAIANHRCAEQGRCKPRAIAGQVAAISVGIVGGRVLLDLDYAEDSNAEVDMNIAMLGNGNFVEVQGSAERAPFTDDELQEMLDMARKGIRKLATIQRQAIREGVK
ncbi:MAG: ribonuclease PH [Phycisphaerae bacterium]|jgi:ribonuclease PH|nr:ribonuclease PH [Phycisphaerae bacterium]